MTRGRGRELKATRDSRSGASKRGVTKLELGNERTRERENKRTREQENKRTRERENENDALRLRVGLTNKSRRQLIG